MKILTIAFSIFMVLVISGCSMGNIKGPANEIDNVNNPALETAEDFNEGIAQDISEIENEESDLDTSELDDLGLDVFN